MDMRRCSIEFITSIPVEKVAAAAMSYRCDGEHTDKFVIGSYTVVVLAQLVMLPIDG